LDPKTLKLFPAPAATVAGLPITQAKEVIGQDLSKMREVSGNSEFGVIGMDFMGPLVIQMDFDAGEVSILKKVPKTRGRRSIFGSTKRGFTFVQSRFRVSAQPSSLLTLGAMVLAT